MVRWSRRWIGCWAMWYWQPDRWLSTGRKPAGATGSACSFKIWWLAGGHRLHADLASKAIRKAQAVIRSGESYCFVQGKLQDDVLSEAGIVAQVKSVPAAAA